MAQQSSSIHWREQGNTIYITAGNNLTPVLRKERLVKASNCYYKALNLSANEDEKVSAAKNLAMASWKTAKVDEEIERISVVLHHYKEAFKYFSMGFNKSEGVKTKTWRDELLASTKSCWEELKAGRVSELNYENRANVYLDLVKSMDISEILGECYIEQANCHFRCGITAIEKKDFKKGLNEMSECYMPINEAKRWLEDKLNIKEEVRILEEDVFMHRCMSEALQAISIGDQLYCKLLYDEESLNMDMVYEVIDWYTQAAVRTREVTEVEIEAIALSRIGKLYDKVLKMKDHAKQYLMKSIELAHSMHPRTFNSEGWFKDCAEILERYQKETVATEQEKWDKERTEVLKGLVKEMEILEKADKNSSDEFLRSIYKDFPPKNAAHKLDGNIKNKKSVSQSALKKVLQKAVVHYHPDKAHVQEHGITWKVLAEEITKRLTRRYECMKGF